MTWGSEVEPPIGMHEVAEHASLPVERVQDIVGAATDRRPRVDQA